MKLVKGYFSSYLDSERQITFTFPASPVLYQYKDINENVYCDQFSTNQDDCYE